MRIAGVSRRPIARRHAGLAAAALLALAGPAAAQSVQPALFVANNGNLEGSVTSFTVNPDSTLKFVQKLVTGAADPGDDDPGTNAYAISISPNGRFLAVSHATSSDTVERITIVEVGADASLELFATFGTPDSPLDLEWVSDELLAVLRTNLSAINELIVYRFDPDAATLTEVSRGEAGVFCAYLSIHPTGRFAYVGDSTGRAVAAFEIGPDGALSTIGYFGTGGIYPLGHAVTPDGDKFYAGGGISSDRNKVIGFSIDAATGALSPLANSPWISPGNSPKECEPSPDGAYLAVAHGTDSTIRIFAIDPESGDLTNTGFFVDIGNQGDHGDTVFLGDLMFASNKWGSPTGVRSFTLHADGSLTENGSQVSTQGVTPTYMAAWPGTACPADFNGDGDLTPADFSAFRSAFLAGDSAADFNGDGDLTPADFSAFRAAFLGGCP